MEYCSNCIHWTYYNGCRSGRDTPNDGNSESCHLFKNGDNGGADYCSNCVDWNGYSCRSGYETPDSSNSKSCGKFKHT